VTRFCKMIAVVTGVFITAMTALPDEVSSAGAGEHTGSRFVGSGEVEKLNDDPFVTHFRLLDELRFEEADGEVWVTPSNAILDGRSVPQLFNKLIGNPFDRGFRKTTITYDFAVKSKFHPWRRAQRMFYDGAVTEGVDPVEAKVMYTLLSASGSRWAQHSPDGCFNRCHNRFKELEWRPTVNEQELVSLLDWVRKENPSLDDIDQQANKAIVDQGPHIMGSRR
jgi:hypothetical protein